MMTSVVVFLGCVVAAVYGQGTLHYSDCNTSPNKIIHFDNGHISVDPIHIPGTETVDVVVQLLRNIVGHHFTVHLQLKKKILFGFVTVPCLNNVGSCDYDLCTVLNGTQYNNTMHCPMEIVESSPNFPCACPFSPGTYTLSPTKFTIPEISGLWSFLATGDYKARVTIKDTNTNEEVFCYDFAVHLDAECSGISCIFG